MPVDTYEYSPFDLYDSVTQTLISYLSKNGVSLPDDKNGFDGDEIAFEDEHISVTVFPIESEWVYFDPEYSDPPEYILQVASSPRYAGVQISVNPQSESAEFYTLQSSVDDEWDMPSEIEKFFDNYAKILKAIKAQPFKPVRFSFEN
jgi:hypothetical protein